MMLKAIRSIYETTPPDQLRDSLEHLLIPTNTEKQNYAEISTPVQLVDEMLEMIPKEFWQKPHSVLEPCCGKGQMVIGIFDHFFKGLEKEIPDPLERCQVIMRQCLYYADLTTINVLITSEIMKCHVRLYGGWDISDEHFHSYVGNTLELDLQKQWKLKEMDLIVGNPPYNDATGNKGTGHTLWNQFVLFLVKMISIGGLLVMVHPSGWRDVKGVYRPIFKLLTDRQLVYLKMNDFQKGKETFGVGTTFDYYLLKNVPYQEATMINDIDNVLQKIDLREWEFLPSGKFEMFHRLLQKEFEGVSILHSESLYEHRKKYMSTVCDEDHPYPCCYTITLHKGLKLLYSSKKKGHFGIPKVIWSNGLGTYPIVDEKGMYGLSSYCFAIVDSPENLSHIANVLKSKEFIHLMTYVRFTNNKYNFKVIETFNKLFYQNF